MAQPQPGAHFDPTAQTVVIEQVTITDVDVAREARRWTTGERGPVIDDLDHLAEADLTAYVTSAMRMGAHALSVAGQAYESQSLGRMVQEVGAKTAESATRSAELTERVVRDATSAVTKAADEAKKAILEADAVSRKEFTDSVTQAKGDLHAEMRRIFGGERPELVDRIQPLLDKFGADLEGKVNASANELLTRAVKQLDPSDPTSPMAKHTARLDAQQEELTRRLNQNHTDLTNKVNELSSALKVREATTALAKVTPIKGDSFAALINTVMADIAGGLGGEYQDTSTTAGALPRCRKGDGVLTTDDGAARVVIEMTDSSRRDWGAYLDEAERNRSAGAALGIVRTRDQNEGSTVRVIGRRRVVLAFDPETDDPDLARTVVLLLRAAALSASVRMGEHEIATAEEKIAEAVEHLAKIDSIKKIAGTIQGNAQKIDRQCDGISSAIRRLLDQALNALAGADSPLRTVAGQHARDGAA